MKLILAFVIFISGQGLALAQNPTPRTAEAMERLHENPQAYIAMLDNPRRDAYQKPNEVISALKLKPGEIIADIGAGSGYFTFRLARQVGSQGRVYAVDVSPDMIIHLNRRIRDLGVTNVATILCPPDDPLLADASVDRFFICDTWHHIQDHPHYLGLLKRMLKPDGQIVMIDYKKTQTPLGPPMEIRISHDDLAREMEANGFRLKTEHTFLPYQYFIVFEKR